MRNILSRKPIRQPTEMESEEEQITVPKKKKSFTGNEYQYLPTNKP